MHSPRSARPIRPATRWRRRASDPRRRHVSAPEGGVIHSRVSGKATSLRASVALEFVPLNPIGLASRAFDELSLRSAESQDLLHGNWALVALMVTGFVQHRAG